MVVFLQQPKCYFIKLFRSEVCLSHMEPIPLRIQELLKEKGVEFPDVKVAFKTAFKPNATIPTIWLIATRDEVLLCSTHRTRGLWKRLSRGEISAIRHDVDLIGSLSIRVIHCSLDEPDLILPLQKTTTPEEVQQCVSLLQV